MDRKILELSSKVYVMLKGEPGVGKRQYRFFQHCGKTKFHTALLTEQRTYG